MDCICDRRVSDKAHAGPLFPPPLPGHDLEHDDLVQQEGGARNCTENGGQAQQVPREGTALVLLSVPATVPRVAVAARVSTVRAVTAVTTVSAVTTIPTVPTVTMTVAAPLMFRAIGRADVILGGGGGPLRRHTVHLDNTTQRGRCFRSGASKETKLAPRRAGKKLKA